MEEMDNLSICKRVAEIEGIQHQIEQEDTARAYIYSEELSKEYNPLTDDALCFKLMVKYKVSITWNPHLDDNCTAVIDGVSEDLPFPFAIADNKDELPNRAICLTIIEAHTRGKYE